ncbi:MAG TPA: EAL domain-containing protein [Acidobacteriaceae bacterium]|nr:EAL domain-containing protein [Acidobacteriaceae bacterium]
MPDTVCVPDAVRASGHKDAAAQKPAASEHPFVERRRSRAVDEIWHDALTPVDRLLRCYEQENRTLAETSETWERLFAEAPVAIFRIRGDGQPLHVNARLAQLCGFRSPQSLLEEVAHLGETLAGDPGGWEELVRKLEDDSHHTFEAEMPSPDGGQRWLELHLRRVSAESGETLGYEGTAADITERKLAECRIHRLAYYDRVTGLPNRALFEERLEDALAEARRRAGQAALLLIELDRFKIINDSLGETFGDRLLEEIAARVLGAAGEKSTVARVSGSEFAVILPDLSGIDAAEQVARRIVSTLGNSFSLLGHSLNVSCNVGISLYPRDGAGADALLKRADVAMYSAREQGPNELRFFTEEMNERIRQRLMLENDLRQALEQKELFLVYQPQVDMRTGAIRGLEALLRWQHPRLGLVPPASFISLAEGTGLIVPIGEWVLRKACSQARQWQMAGLPAVPVAVNVSAIQFRHEGFAKFVRNLLEETGLEAKYLELELTEGVLLTNEDLMFAMTQELRSMGVKLTIDDFGTGYSSLGYLRQFKVNRLKIDRSFVRDVPMNADDTAIATAIIQMAKALNLEVLAEGVENERQLAFLRSQHCYEIQGFYYSKPVTVEMAALQLQAAFLEPA